MTRTAAARRPVGNTVDVAEATYKNSIGAPLLTGYWKDPDFDPQAARLLLRPRPRNPDPALDDLRREVLRREAPGGRARLHPGARLHLAHLVYAGPAVSKESWR